jgi:MoaA/NifB/PqqE/SkfB family radical SAM enzyme
MNPHSFAAKKRDLPQALAAGCGTTNHFARIWNLRTHYVQRVRDGLSSGLRPLDLLRTQFPFVVSDAKIPPAISVELTNYCNLQCPYCTVPLKLRSEGMMAQATFSRLVEQIRTLDIRHVRLVGTGEPTLHPQFIRFVRQLATATRFLSLTSNWQRVTKGIVRAIIEAPVKLLNISVDGRNKNEYEKSRVGGNFEKLLENLELLRDVRGEYRQRKFVNIRVMLRPSERPDEINLMQFWRKYGDEVTRQYIADWSGLDRDVYALECEVGRYPRCTLPFKQLDVYWNGNVPLCTYSHLQSGNREGVLLGNINDSTLGQLWNSPLIRNYRHGHRARDNSLTPICKGCAGC